MDALCEPRPQQEQARKCVPFCIFIPFQILIMTSQHQLRAHPTLRPWPRLVRRPHTPLSGSEAYAAPELVTSGRALRSSRPLHDGHLGLRHRPLCRVCPPAAVWGCTHRREGAQAVVGRDREGGVCLASDRVRPAGAGGIRGDL